MEKKTRFLSGVLKYVMLYGFFVALGFILGMAYQQVLITQEVGNILSYSNIDINVNMNETKLVDYTMQRFNETILPQLKPPYDINYNATCPGLNKTKTVEECIKEVENGISK